MAREVYLSADPEQLLQFMNELDSDHSDDDDFDGYIDDDDEEIQERITREGGIGSGLEGKWGTGEVMEALVNVGGGNPIGGSRNNPNGSIVSRRLFRGVTMENSTHV